jgi:hypothetical protein
MSQWQPIETAPRDGTPIVILCDLEEGPTPAVARWQDTNAAGPHGRFVWRTGWSAVAEGCVKYWFPMPLPEPPPRSPDQEHCRV